MDESWLFWIDSKARDMYHDKEVFIFSYKIRSNKISPFLQWNTICTARSLSLTENNGVMNYESIRKSANICIEQYNITRNEN